MKVLEIGKKKFFGQHVNKIERVVRLKINLSQFHGMVSLSVCLVFKNEIKIKNERIKLYENMIHLNESEKSSIEKLFFN